MRILPIVVVLGALSIPACGASLDGKIPDEHMLQVLEQRANQAQPREQCFLYAELVHEMVEYSAHEYATGNVERATGLLKRAQLLTRRIHAALATNAKKLKDAQILLRHTSFRLTELLHSSAYDDRPLVEETLADLNQAQDETMLELFKK